MSNDLDKLAYGFMVLFLGAIFVIVVSFIIEVIRCVGLFKAMKTQKHQAPILAFVPYLNHFMEGDVISNVLQYDGKKAIICKLCYLATAFSSGFVSMVGSTFLNVNTDVDSVDLEAIASEFSLGSISELLKPTVTILPLVFSIVALVFTLYLLATKLMALHRVGYQPIAILLIMICVQPFYLFFLNKKMKELNMYPEKNEDSLNVYAAYDDRYYNDFQ